MFQVHTSERLQRKLSFVPTTVQMLVTISFTFVIAQRNFSKRCHIIKLLSQFTALPIHNKYTFIVLFVQRLNSNWEGKFHFE
jgi:hypothetical protein